MNYNSAVVELDQSLDHEAAERGRAQFRADLDQQMCDKHDQQRRDAALKADELRREHKHFERIQRVTGRTVL